MLYLGALLVVAVLAGSPDGMTMCRQGVSRVYYVDWASGDDTADGCSPGTAWKHAPGDAGATGNPRQLTLKPGDHVRFSQSSIYRGSVRLPFAGTATQPIILESWPDAGAIISGSRPLKSRACTSADDCGGSAQWTQLRRADLPTDVNASAVFDGGTWLRPAQFPHSKSALNPDDVSNYLQAEVGSHPGELKVSAAVAELIRTNLPFGPRLMLHVTGNEVVERKIGSVVKTTVYYERGNEAFPEGPVRFAVSNLISELARPGEFAVDQRKGIIVFFPKGSGSDVSVGTDQIGIDLSGGSHIIVSGLTFEQFSSPPGASQVGYSIVARRAGTSNLVVRNNLFRSMYLRNGNAPITVLNADSVDISDNVIQDIAYGRGLLIGSSSGVHISRNKVTEVGRTGIMVINSNSVVVDQNIISGIYGIHGNGASLYRGNVDILFAGNLIFDAASPMTVQGAGAGSPAARNIVIRQNVIIGSGSGGYALTSWGGGIAGMCISNNILLGGGAGLGLSSRDRPGTVVGNVTNGIGVYPPSTLEDWVIQDNLQTSFGRGTFARGTTTAGELDKDARMLLRTDHPISGFDRLLGRVGTQFGDKGYLKLTKSTDGDSCKQP